MRWKRALLASALAALACNSGASRQKTAPHAARTTDTGRAAARPAATKPPPVAKDGTVYAVNSSELPGKGPAAAIFRY